MTERKKHHMGVGSCPQCGSVWTGYKAEHCVACHETFTGNEAGEKHRKGEYPDRRCSTEDLFWNKKRQMWQATEPGSWEVPDSWRRDERSSQ